MCEYVWWECMHVSILMLTCAWVCVCIVWMYMCIHAHSHMCVYRCVYGVTVHVYPHSCSHACVCVVQICVCIHVHAHMCMRGCVWCECTCLSMFLLMCVYGATIHVYPHSCSRVCIYIHIHAHMCLHVCGSSELTDNVFLDITLFIYLFTDTRSLVAARTPNSS